MALRFAAHRCLLLLATMAVWLPVRASAQHPDGAAALDDPRAPAHILLEVRTVEVTEEVERELGIQWGDAGDLTMLRPPTSTASGNEAAWELTVGELAGQVNLNLRIGGDPLPHLRILSAPRITTLDRHPVRVVHRMEIPFREIGSQGIHAAVHTSELVLQITPEHDPRGEIALDIAVSRDEPGPPLPARRGALSVIRRRARLAVQIADGGSVVIGGIRTARPSRAPDTLDRGLPLIGSLIADGESEEADALLIFVTPHVVRDGVRPLDEPRVAARPRRAEAVVR